MRYLTHFLAFLLSRTSRVVCRHFARPWLFHISNKRDKSQPRALGAHWKFPRDSSRSRIASGGEMPAKRERVVVNGASPDICVSRSLGVLPRGACISIHITDEQSCSSGYRSVIGRAASVVFLKGQVSELRHELKRVFVNSRCYLWRFRWFRGQFVAFSERRGQCVVALPPVPCATYVLRS